MDWIQKESRTGKTTDRAKKKPSKINRMALNIFPPKTGKQPKSQALQLICHQHILNPLGKQRVSHGCQHRTRTATATGYCHQRSHRGWRTRPRVPASPTSHRHQPRHPNSCVPQTLNAARTACSQHIQCVKVSNVNECKPPSFLKASGAAVLPPPPANT